MFQPVIFESLNLQIKKESFMFFRPKVKTYILDGTVLADGRVVPLIEKELFAGRFILVSQPVYQATPKGNNNEPSYITRINENIERIKQITHGKVMIQRKQLHKDEFLKLAKKHNAKIILMTNEDKAVLMTEAPQTTAKVIKIITLGEIYEVLKPDYLPGAEIKVVVTKKGKEVDEGIGYLDGGIKVVVSGGARAMGKELDVVVQGSIETNVGKLIFAKPKYIEIK
jgi:uncharacterized protein YacL